MRFNIGVQKTGALEWQVTVTCVGAVTSVLHTRTLRRSGHQQMIFPLPPTTETDSLAADEPHYKLCTTGDTADIYGVYGDLINKSFAKKDVLAFGRYLFATLIGDEAWRKIVAEADTVSPIEPIELILSWPESEWELYRLPWELMRHANGFIAAERRVSIVRVVSGVQSRVAQITLRPRVLFIVGSNLNDEEVRPGAEFYGVLRRLESLGLSFCHRVLQNATSQQIEDEIAAFQPTVVHFICHGGFDKNGISYLDVAPEKPTDEPQHLYPQALLALLNAGNSLPPIVVLNACYTGNPPLMREAPPLAVELVKGNIPMVVGMGGRVADLACRLFTRRFYEALLRGESVATSASHGRRAGITHLGAQAEEAIDWAMPTLFLAEGLSPEVTIDAAWMVQHQQRERYAVEYRSMNTPPSFANRYEFFDSYHQLLNAAQPTMPVTVMAIEMDAWEPKLSKPQYGKTRLLHELAAQAVRDVHIPCLVTFKEKTDAPPVNAMQLGKVLLGAIRQARIKFDLNRRPDFEFMKLERKQIDPTIVLHHDVQDELDFEPDKQGRAVRAALQRDLLALQDEARAKFAHPSLKVLVLLDEVHRFDDGAREFVNHMLRPGGLGDDDNPVPVIFTFSSAGIPSEYNTALLILKTFLENRPLYVNHLSLGAFRPPKDEWLIYQQFLLHQEPPLIMCPESESKSQDVYDTLYDEMMGVPSQLNSKEVQAAIRMAKKLKFLIVADDDEVLRKQA